MSTQLDTAELKQIADDLRGIGLGAVANTLLRAAEEIERLRVIADELDRLNGEQAPPKPPKPKVRKFFNGRDITETE